MQGTSQMWLNYGTWDGKIFLDFQGGPNNHKGPLRREEGSQRVREETRTLKAENQIGASWETLDQPSQALKMKEHCYEPRMRAASRKQKSQGNRFSSRASRKELSSAHTWFKPRRPLSDFFSIELYIHKSVVLEVTSLWSFFTASIGN